jgi:hypothetical protein
MKKCTALFILAFAVFQIASAQASYTSVSYNKSSQPALMLELPYNVEISEGFIVDNLKKTGYDPETKGKLFWKQNKLNGFYIFKDVRLEGAPGTVDLYFKVDQKSKRQKDASVIYLLIGKGENSFVSSDSDNDTYTAAKRFLNGFVDKSDVYKHDLDIKNQEDQKDQEKKIEDEKKKLEDLKGQTINNA